MKKILVVGGLKIEVGLMRVLNKMHFEATSTAEISDEVAREVQSQCGFMPAGYGKPEALKSNTLHPGEVCTTWECWASCE